MEGQGMRKISILMLPWLAHGHILPLFEFAKKLSQFSYFSIHIYSTPINLESIRGRINPSPSSSNIHFIEMKLPADYDEVLPPHYQSTKNLPPHLNPTLIKAFDDVKPAFINVLKEVKPDILIYDICQPYGAALAARELDIQAVMYSAVGTDSLSFLFHYSKYDDSTAPFTRLPHPENEPRDTINFLNATINGVTRKDRFCESVAGSSDWILIRTSTEIEAKHMEYLSELTGKLVVSTGIFIQDLPNTNDDTRILDWLNKKDPQSVVYLSFGSEYFFSKEEIGEIAYGLELSNVNFIWVLRFPAREDSMTIDEALPKGFKERIGEKGLVESWVPQAKILGHSNVGGFVSHCGWGSILEGIYFGVPIIAMPMQLEQPLHSKLVVDDIGIGIEVKRVDGKVKGEELAKVVKDVVGEEEGKELRRKAKELGERVREKADEEMNVVVQNLLNLLKRKENIFV